MELVIGHTHNSLLVLKPGWLNPKLNIGKHDIHLKILNLAIFIYAVANKWNIYLLKYVYYFKHIYYQHFPAIKEVLCFTGLCFNKQCISLWKINLSYLLNLQKIAKTNKLSNEIYRANIFWFEVCVIPISLLFLWTIALPEID